MYVIIIIQNFHLDLAYLLDENKILQFGILFSNATLLTSVDPRDDSCKFSSLLFKMVSTPLLQLYLKCYSWL